MREKFTCFIFLILCLATSTAKAQTILFESTTAENHHFRIPSIVRLNDGTLMAFSDSRQKGSQASDVGYGWIDMMCKTSSDNGNSWGSSQYIVKHSGTSGFNYAFGDAATVVDRESGDVLMMNAAGSIGALGGDGTVDGNVQIARTVRSAESGIWSTPSNISQNIYKNISLTCSFFSSGRIVQSTKVKVGDYYRLYAGVNTRPNGSRVMYSDDFGATWNYLGGTSATPSLITSGVFGDECKVEELPNGDVLLCCRVSGDGATGRIFNVFSFTDIKNAAGSWGTCARSGKEDTNGETYTYNTNGEVLLVPAVRKTDNKTVYVLLVSAPMSSTREKVGIYYKELPSEYTNPENYKSGWSKYQVTSNNSGYSTMILDQNGEVAFYFERDWVEGTGYDMVFQSISLSEITGGDYEYSTNKEYVTTSDPVVVTISAPVFSINSGTYTNTQTVELTCETEDATIYYTTDGSAPTTQHTKYTGAITIDKSTTLKAIAIDNYGNASRVVTATYSIVAEEETASKRGTTISLDNQSCHQLFSNGASNESMDAQYFSFLRHDIAHIQMLSSSTRQLTTEGAGIFAKIDNNMLFKEVDGENYLHLYNGLNSAGERQPYCFIAIVAPKGYRFTRYQMEFLPENSTAGATIAQYTYNDDGTEKLFADSVTISSNMEPWDKTLTNGTNVLYFRYNSKDNTQALPVALKSLKLTYVIDQPFTGQIPTDDGTLDIHTGLLDLGTFSSNKSTHSSANGGAGYWSFDDQRVITDGQEVSVFNKQGDKQTEIVTVDGGQYFVAAANGDYYIETPQKFRVVGASINFLRSDAEGMTEVTYSDYTPSTSANGDVIVIGTASGVYLNNNNGTIEAGTNIDNATRWTVTYVKNNGYTIKNGNYYLYMVNETAGIKVRTSAAYWSYSSQSGNGFSYNLNRSTKYIYYGSVWGFTSNAGSSNALLKKVTTTIDGRTYTGGDFTATVFNREDNGTVTDGEKQLDASNSTGTVTVSDYNNDAVHFNISGLTSGTVALYNVNLTILPLNPEVQTLQVAANINGSEVGTREVTSLNYTFHEGEDVSVLVPKNATSPYSIVFRKAENEEKTQWYSDGTPNNSASEGGYSNYYLIGSNANTGDYLNLEDMESQTHPDDRANSDVACTEKHLATNIEDVFDGKASELKDNEFVKNSSEYEPVSLANNASKTVYIYSADEPTFQIMPAGLGSKHIDYRYYTITVKPIVVNEKPVVEFTTIYEKTMKGAPHKTNGNSLTSDGNNLDTTHKYVGVTVSSEPEQTGGTTYGVLTNKEIIEAIKDKLAENNYFGFSSADPYRSILYVDMSGLNAVSAEVDAQDANYWDSFNDGTADNCLYFMPVGFIRNVENTIRKQGSGYEAVGDIVVFDQQPFFTPHGFVTGNRRAKYEREGTVNGQTSAKATVRNMTAVLPFTIALDGEGHLQTSGDAVDNSVTFHNITKSGPLSDNLATDSANYAMLAEPVTDSKAKANQPYYVTSTTPGFSFSILGAQFEPSGTVADNGVSTNALTCTNNSWTATGTYSGVQIEKADNLWYFAKEYFWKSGLLKTYNNVNIRPFRAHYTTNNATDGSAKAIVVFSESDFGTATSIGNATACSGLRIAMGKGCITVAAGQATSLKVFNMAGQLTAEGRLAAGETRRISLPQGVYVVNGTKVAVR